MTAKQQERIFSSFEKQLDEAQKKTRLLCRLALSESDSNVELIKTARAIAAEADYNSEWGPAIGSTLPLLEAIDQAGQVRKLDDLAGEQGLLLFLNRSADW